MAQENNSHFLTIPSQEDLFRTVRPERFEDNSNDEDEEETEEDVRLIPRSSPIPRKRGTSIADETAEYMRIRLALPTRSVSFADSSGAELVDVRLFVPFDSDDEDDARWEEEKARYRKAYREPTYRVWPEFQPLTGAELVHAVHSNKLEVESVTSVPDEPLSFEVLIRVLNISFKKSVYARSTMDGWISHFDYPADYVQGSNEGETDKFSVKLAFASPYLFNGARIDFVLRYETADGEFWANNSGRNYSVTLLQSFEDDTILTTTEDTTELRGILKPPRYRADIGFDDSDDREEDADLSSTKCEAAENQASSAQPVTVQPEIDIETAKNSSISPEFTRTSSTAGCPQFTLDTPPGEPLALESMSSNSLPQTEESGLQPSTLSVPQSRSTQQFSEQQDQFYNVGPSLPLPLPSVLVHHYDHPETSKDEFEDSSKPDQSLHPQKDYFHSDMLAQVPFELGQPSLAGLPDMPQIQEEGMQNVKDKEDVKEKDDILTDVPEEPSRNAEEDKTGTYFHMLEEAKQLPASNEVNNAIKDVEECNLSEGSQPPLEEGIPEQKLELASSVRVETTKTTEVESTKMDEEETDGLVPSHLGPTRKDKESQSFLIHPVSNKPETIQHQQEEGLVLDPSMLASVLPDDPHLDNQTVSMCIPEHPVSKPEKPELISISETLPTAFNLQPSTVNSSEDELIFEGGEPSTAPYQTCEDPGTLHTLPRHGTKLSQISKDATLETCLVVPATFFTVVICLAVGIQEPSFFLCVGLFLFLVYR